MVDGDFDSLVRVAASTVTAVAVVFVIVDFTLLTLLLICLPLGGQAAFFRLVGLFGALALVDE